MRENRTYGSEGGEPVMGNSPTPISGHLSPPHVWRSLRRVLQDSSGAKCSGRLGEDTAKTPRGISEQRTVKRAAVLQLS